MLTENEREQFVSESDSRETSPEIMNAIADLADSYDEAVAIWEDGHSWCIPAIVEKVTKNGMYETTDFVWGAAGETWGK